MNRERRYDVTIHEREFTWAYIKRYESRDDARAEAVREFPAAKIVNVVPLPEDAHASR